MNNKIVTWLVLGMLGGLMGSCCGKIRITAFRWPRQIVVNGLGKNEVTGALRAQGYNLRDATAISFEDHDFAESGDRIIDLGLIPGLYRILVGRGCKNIGKVRFVGSNNSRISDVKFTDVDFAGLGAVDQLLGVLPSLRFIYFKTSQNLIKAVIRENRTVRVLVFDGVGNELTAVAVGGLMDRLKELRFISFYNTRQHKIDGLGEVMDHRGFEKNVSKTGFEKRQEEPAQEEPGFFARMWKRLTNR